MIREAARLSSVSEYYFSAKLREVAAMRARGLDVLNLGIGNPDLAPDDKVIRALNTSAADPGRHGYQPYKGLPELREAMAQWYRRTYNVDLDPDREVLPLIGSKEGVFYICQAFIDPGDRVLVPDPGYPAYAAAVRLAGGIPVPYALEEGRQWSPDRAFLVQELGRSKLWFVNYPHMPTGQPGSRELMQALVDLAAEHGVLLVNDNPYSLVLHEGQPLSIHQAAGSREAAVELNSLSKSHNMAGWRVGMLTGHSAALESVLKVKSNVDSGMFRPLQDAAVRALEADDAWHAARNRVYAARRSAAGRILDALGCTWDHSQVGMFLWARVPDQVADAEALTEQLLQEKHVFLTPGFIFGEGGRRHIRISLCVDESIMERALERIRSNGQ